MKNKLLKMMTGALACFAILTIGTHCYNGQLSKAKMDEIMENNEPIIYTEVSHYDTLYNFSDSNILKENSDLVVIGRLTNLGEATNYNPVAKKYTKATTPGELEVVKVIKADKKMDVDTIEFLNIGGTIKYEDYEKSLLPAQKAKREYLMQKNGNANLTKSNIFVKQEVKNQLELEENKTYIMYLYYNEAYGKYMVVSQPYGIKEYNMATGKILNHVTNEVETLEELM